MLLLAALEEGVHLARAVRVGRATIRGRRRCRLHLSRARRARGLHLRGPRWLCRGHGLAIICRVVDLTDGARELPIRQAGDLVAALVVLALIEHNVIGWARSLLSRIGYAGLQRGGILGVIE